VTGSTTRPARTWHGVVTPTGWTVLVLALLAAVTATLTQWRELAVLAVACLALLVLALPFLAGRGKVAVDLVVEPLRVVAGESVSAGVRLTNQSAGRLLPTVLDLPVGEVEHRYRVPMLAPGETHEEAFTIRTERRGVIPVGPATTRRGDPLGLFSRDLGWTQVTEVLVRPPMVPLDSLGAGLLRDLEGVSTDAVSQSDLAFHTLREYVPGDELRHVHWRSSAKAMAAAGTTQLLVRQYLDTKRSHATVVVDDTAAAWIDPLDFETAMSVAASLAVRAVLDEFDTSFVCGDQVSTGRSGHLALDAICRADFGRVGLLAAVHRASVVAPDTSLLFVISGAAATFQELNRATSAFGHETRRIVLLVDPTAISRGKEADGVPMLHLARREDLAGLLRWSVR
jgi:uncharacterized protein (DUF58 family)